uniref:hypothetical protein n=1 Tax=Bacillus sp. B-3 TaxID=119423 RepID=UPI00159ED5F6|nr:hypothetical protein [Bacillus sp. B-3]
MRSALLVSPATSKCSAVSKDRCFLPFQSLSFPVFVLSFKNSTLDQDKKKLVSALYFQGFIGFFSRPAARLFYSKKAVSFLRWNLRPSNFPKVSPSGEKHPSGAHLG